MRVERATLQQVQERFEVLKKRKAPEGFTEQDLDERIRKQQEEEEERKRLRREKKKEKKVSSSCAVGLDWDSFLVLFVFYLF
ncbi:hypothetical protein B296_00058813 [Ensete ventricosum]|uniref:Uncharacterized protein n=1 Tax=Ensete ventricosum TaxID=4639 RepID=A0A426XKB0_ENSVE|nr:hypothetical protein B296_00058813 [Ensete ventricosum]